MSTTKSRAEARAKALKEKEEREAAEQLQREKQKKERDAERKREEEEAKKARDADEAAKTADDATSAGQGDPTRDEDMPDAGINEHLNEMNNGGEGEGTAETPAANLDFNVGTDDGEERSPQKKRSKKDKKDKKKSSRKEKGEKEKGVDSILKTGRFSQSTSEEKKKKEAEEKSRAEKAAEAARARAKEEEEKKEWREKHIHMHKRNVVECSLVCSQEEEQQRYNELPAAVRLLLNNMQKVDKYVCLDPVEEGEAPKVWDPSGVSYDHTELGSYIQQGGGMQAFSMKKPKKWQKDQGFVGEDELVMPEIYFTLCFSSEKDPDRILERVAGEWGKAGGKKLYLKDIASFDTKTAVTIFHLRHDNDDETILAEFVLVLEEAKKIAEDEDEEGSMRFILHDLPLLNIRKFIPRIDGQDTKPFSGWSGKQHDNRKCISVECDGGDVELIHYLVQTAKNRRLFEKYWGPKVYVAAIVDSKAKGKGKKKQSQSKLDLASMASCSRMHINYTGNTRMDGIRGILHLDKQVNFYAVSDPTKLMGTITLRRILYKYLKMSDGHHLFEEVHQAHPLAAVDVAVPNCEEAERMMLMMQKNPAAYITFYLRHNTELGESLIANVVRASMDPILVNSIGGCKWDKKLWVLETPEDAENEKHRAMESAAWYNDEFGDHMVDTSKKERREYANKEALDELHGDHSFKTISTPSAASSEKPEAV
jgi:hypothetical protein